MNYPTKQVSLDLQIEKQAEVDGVEMGVLSDGTPYLTGRGLARLCGVDNATIVRLGAEWNEHLQKPRISRIKGILTLHQVSTETPYFVHGDKRLWIGSACLAVLEYYAFDANQGDNAQALRNFRILAGKGFQKFVYDWVGYNPADVPDKWRQFHDRVSLVHDKVPEGYFSVFKEIADLIVTLGQRGLHIDDTFVPDISVGKIWGVYWRDNMLDLEYGDRIQFEHHYPEYFPQAECNPQPCWCYPEAALPAFRKWYRTEYIGSGKFEKYLKSQSKAQRLPAAFTRDAIEAVNRKYLPSPQ